MSEQSTGIVDASATRSLRLKETVEAQPSQTVIKELRAMDLKLRDETVLRPDEINLTLRLVHERGLDNIYYQQAMAAIRKVAPFATAVSDEINTLGNTLIDTTDGPQKLNDYVHEQHDTPLVRNGRKPKGTYSHRSRSIRYEAPKQTPQDQLRALAMTGRHTDASQIAFHERAHAVQHNLGLSKAIPPELREAHAHRVGGSFDLMDSEQAVKLLAPKYPRLDKRKLHAALQLIDQLNALGYSQEGIVEIIGRPGEWNRRKRSWQQAEEVVQRERARQGLSTDELARRIVIRTLQTSIDISRARLATQNVLLDAFRPELTAQRNIRTRLGRNHVRPPIYIPRGLKAS